MGADERIHTPKTHQKQSLSQKTVGSAALTAPTLTLLLIFKFLLLYVFMGQVFPFSGRSTKFQNHFLPII